MATIKSQLVLNDGMSSVLSKISGAMMNLLNNFEALNAASGHAVNLANLEETRSTLIGVAQACNGVTGSLNAAGYSAERFNRNISAGGGAANGLLDKFKRVATTVGAGLGIQKVLELSDQMSGAKARLNLIVDDGGSVDALEKKIMASANRSRASYLDTVQTVSKLGLLAGDAFSGNDEMIKFTELMNKNFVIAGASASEQSNAMYQLQQAMASGRLQGDEYRSIIENAPLLATAIEEYMQNAGVKGTMKEWAADGLLTADVIKNALFASSDEVEERFKQIPMTWGQAWTLCKNMLTQIFDPILQIIGAGAQWVVDNWSTVEPIFWGLAAGVGAYAIALGIQTAATWIATGAAKAFFAALLSNPLTWIAIAIAAVVMIIYKWIQSVGGIKIAWLIACNAILTAVNWVKIGFFVVVYGIIDLWNKLQLRLMEGNVAIANFMGDMKANVLMILQSMVNGAIGIINDFIGVLNKIPGVNIGLIENVTFGTTAQLKNEAEKKARNVGLEAYRKDIETGIAERAAGIAAMKSEAHSATASRSAEISAAQAQAKADAAKDGQDLVVSNTAATAENTGAAADALSGTEEDLKYLRDIAEQEVINRFTTAEIRVEMVNNNSIGSDADINGIIGNLVVGVSEAMSMAAEGVHS